LGADVMKGKVKNRELRQVIDYLNGLSKTFDMLQFLEGTSLSCAAIALIPVSGFVIASTAVTFMGMQLSKQVKNIFDYFSDLKNYEDKVIEQGQKFRYADMVLARLAMKKSFEMLQLEDKFAFNWNVNRELREDGEKLAEAMDLKREERILQMFKNSNGFDHIEYWKLIADDVEALYKHRGILSEEGIDEFKVCLMGYAEQVYIGFLSEMGEQVPEFKNWRSETIGAEVFQGNRGIQVLLELAEKQGFDFVEVKDAFEKLLTKLESMELKMSQSLHTGSEVPMQLTDNPPVTSGFIGREKELGRIRKSLRENHTATIVNGIGGIGKTEVAKEYYWNEKNNGEYYEHYGWLNYDGSLASAFIDQLKLGLVFDKTEDMEQRFSKVRSIIDKIESNVLLVIDNYDVDLTVEEIIKEINVIRSFNKNVDILLTSRVEIKSLKKIPLGFFNEEELLDLFEQHYGELDDVENVKEIIRLAGNHTLTVELIAKVGCQSFESTEAILSALIGEGFNLDDVFNCTVDTEWHDETPKKMYEHLLKVFDISGLSEDECDVLMNLSVLPTITDPKFVMKWLDLKGADLIHSLRNKGWVYFDKNDKSNGRVVVMHPVFQDTIRHRFEPDVGKCDDLIQSIIDEMKAVGISRNHEKRYLVKYLGSIIKKLDDGGSRISYLCNELALIYKDLGDYPKALEFQERSLEIRGKIYEPGHSDIGTSCNNMAVIYQALGDYTNALEYQERSLEIRENAYEPDHPVIATSSNNMAVIYKALGDYPKALEYQERSLEIRENAYEPDHPDIATSCNNMSTIYQALGDYPKALEYQERSLEIRENAYEPDHPDIATSCNNMAVIYKALGDYPKALEYQERSLEIMENICGPYHPDIATSSNNMAVIYKALGDYPKALEFHERSLEIMEKIYEPDHPYIAISCNNMSLIYQVLGNYPKALEFHERSLEIMEKIYETDHPYIATSCNNISGIYIYMEEYNNALSNIERAIEIREKRLPANHPDTKSSYEIRNFINKKLAEEKK